VILSEPEAELESIGSRNLTLRWEPECKTNMMRYKVCADSGIEWNITLMVVEDLTADYLQVKIYTAIISKERPHSLVARRSIGF